MTIDDKIRDKKLQHDINREVAKISALSSGKINKYEYLTGEEILPKWNNRIRYEKCMRTNEIKNEINDIKKWENKIK